MERELQPGLRPEGDGGWYAMTAQTGNSSIGEDVVGARSGAWQRTGGWQPNGLPPVADCIAIALIPPVMAGLQRLQARTNLSQTDITNRAITLYEFIESQLSAGRELLIRDEVTGEIRRVLIA